MYSYFNPNPIKNKRVGDCVVRAISKALNQSWEETYIELCLLGYIMGDWGSSNAVWNAYLKSKYIDIDIEIVDNYHHPELLDTIIVYNSFEYSPTYLDSFIPSILL